MREQTWNSSVGTAVSFKAFPSFLFSMLVVADPDPGGGKRVPPRPVVVVDLAIRKAKSEKILSTIDRQHAFNKNSFNKNSLNEFFD